MERLTFEAVDADRFPCFALAQRAMRDGLRSCVVLNAANELAVEAFLAGHIPFQGIAGAVEHLLSQGLMMLGTRPSHRGMFLRWMLGRAVRLKQHFHHKFAVLVFERCRQLMSTNGWCSADTWRQ